MSDTQNPAAPAAPAPSDVGGIAKQVKKLREAFGDMTLEKFKGRLEEERSAGMKAALKALGVPKEQRDGVLGKIGEYAIAPKQKDGEPGYEDLRKEAAEVKALRAKVEQHSNFFKQHADTEFGKLPELAQKEIARRKISDPEAVLEEIRAMRESGILDALAGAKPAASAPAEGGKPATTAAAPGPAKQAPSPADAKSPKQKYEDLKKVNRFMAARYRQVMGSAIDK